MGILHGLRPTHKFMRYVDPKDWWISASAAILHDILFIGGLTPGLAGMTFPRQGGKTPKSGRRAQERQPLRPLDESFGTTVRSHWSRDRLSAGTVFPVRHNFSCMSCVVVDHALIFSLESRPPPSADSLKIGPGLIGVAF